MSKCPRCGAEYEPVDDIQLYCSGKCRRKAAKSRGRQRKAKWRPAPPPDLVGRCPTPYKIVVRHDEVRKGYRTYQCPCGASHLTTQRVPEENK